MPKVLDTPTWVAHGMNMLAEGKYPAAFSLEDASGQVGVTKGSLYRHFGNAENWYRAVIDQWAKQRKQERDRAVHQVRMIRSPLDRLRFLRGAAEATAKADLAMRNWSASAKSCAGEAAAALAAIRADIQAEVAAALRHLGLTDCEADLMSGVLVREFGCGPGDPAVAFGDDDGFNVFLAVIARSVRTDLLAPEGVEVGGDEDDGSLMVYVAGIPGTVDKRKLAEQTREFLRSQVTPAGEAPAVVGTRRQPSDG